MRQNSTSSVGALHPILFMLLVYVISIVLAFFVCRMVYYSLHGNTSAQEVKLDKITAITVSQ